MQWVFTEEEPKATVLMALASVSTARPSLGKAPPSPTPEIHLDENRLFVQLKEKGGGGSTRWILNTGAMNHMMGDCVAISEIDTGVRVTVWFRDSSKVNIEGRSTVLFKCKSGEHQVLVDIYFIPRLTANVVSLG